MNQITSLSLMGTIVVLAGGCAQEQVTQSPPPPPVQVAQVVPANPANLSLGAAEVLRLAQAGSGDDVLIGYVQNYNAPFALSSDQIVYLQNANISSAVISAMLNRDSALRAQGQVYATAPAPAPVYTPAPAPDAAPAPVYVSSPPPDVTCFYDGLSPYGAWVQLDGVGWCWQPQEVVINRAWQPYCDGGHWVYTDAGWYWQSDYAWGWAPFHYGRWQLHERCGWVWIPDRVWGPSWVVWRTEGDHCGWAPLPPHADFDVHSGWRFNGVSVAATFDFGLRPESFTFIGWHDFNEHDISHRRLAPTDVTRIYNNTTIVNNYVVNNTTIINQGIKVERVAAATHSQIQRVAIHDAPTGSTPGRDVPSRTHLEAPARSATAMVAQKVDAQHPVIAHTATPIALPTRSVHTPTATGTAQAGHTTQPSQPVVVTRAQPTAPAAAHPSSTTHPTPGGSLVANGNAQQSVPIAHASHPSVPEQPKPVSRTTTALMPAPKPAPAPTVVRQAEQLNPAPTSAGAARPEGGQLHPLQNNTPSRPPGGQTTANNSHVYQPKSGHQAAEAHALPPLNAHGAHSNTPNGAKGQSPKTQ